jgi:hypothetical protein
MYCRIFALSHLLVLYCPHIGQNDPICFNHFWLIDTWCEWIVSNRFYCDNKLMTGFDINRGVNCISTSRDGVWLTDGRARIRTPAREHTINTRSHARALANARTFRPMGARIALKRCLDVIWHMFCQVSMLTIWWQTMFRPVGWGFTPVSKLTPLQSNSLLAAKQCILDLPWTTNYLAVR